MFTREGQKEPMYGRTPEFHVLRSPFMVGVTLRRFTYSIMFIIFIVLTYKATRLKHNKVFNVIKNSSEATTSSKQRFTYSDEDVYNTIKKIRFSNCERKYPRGGKCANVHLCDKLSELTVINDCKGTVECHAAPYQNKTNERGMCKRRLPRALIIGTYKSGTRELVDFLAMNPSVVMKRQPQYEVSYFDKQADKGLHWYNDQMPFSCQWQVTIEKSPGYFASEEAPRRIFEMDKDIKLILIVRNPTDRTISHLTFEDYIAREQYGNDINNCLFKYALNRRIINKNCFAIKASIYDKPLERYLKYFTIEQIHIIDAAEFIEDPCTVLKKLEEFLNIDKYIDCNNFVYNRHKGFYCVQDNTFTAGKISCYGLDRGRMQPRTELGYLKDLLQTLFQPHNERFFKLVGKRFVWE